MHHSFCGAGGLTKGLEKGGIEVRLGVDVDPACEYPFAENNSGEFLLKSVTDVSAEDIADYYDGDSIKLLAGCAPCQTFSSYNQKATNDDARWWLLLEFGRLVEEIKPQLVTMENVPGLEDQDVFLKFIENLEQQGYYVSKKIIDCSEYGLAQQRKRLVLLASKLGEIEVISSAKFKRKKKRYQ